MAFQGVDPVRVETISNVTATLGSRDPQLGAKCTQDGKEYIFVYNGGNSDIEKGKGAVLQGGSGTAGHTCTVSSASGADFLVGVCEHATLTTGTYGWLLQKGLVTVEMESGSSGVTGALLALAADGEFAFRSASTGFAGPVVGKLMESAASGASALAYVSVY